MLIIIEGVDGAGKTTFANDLSVMLGERRTTLRHLGPPKGDPLAECLEALADYEPRDGKHLILDRLHLGELIYGPIYRGESQLAGSSLAVIHKEINRLGGLIVHLDVPLDVIHERIDVRGDDYVKVKDLPAIHAAYQVLAGEIDDVPMVTIDTRNPNAVMQTMMLGYALECAA